MGKRKERAVEKRMEEDKIEDGAFSRSKQRH